MKNSDNNNETIILFEPENLAEMHEFFQNNCEQCTVPTRGDDGKIVAMSCGILWTGKNADTHSNFYPREWIRGEQHIPQCTAMQTDQISLLDQPDLIPADDEQNSTIPSFALVALLSLVSITMTVQEIDLLTDEEKQQAHFWASCLHLAASDNNVDVPPKPEFLPEYSTVEEIWEESA